MRLSALRRHTVRIKTPVKQKTTKIKQNRDLIFVRRIAHIVISGSIRDLCDTRLYRAGSFRRIPTVRLSSSGKISAFSFAISLYRMASPSRSAAIRHKLSPSWTTYGLLCFALESSLERCLLPIDLTFSNIVEGKTPLILLLSDAENGRGGMVIF